MWEDTARVPGKKWTREGALPRENNRTESRYISCSLGRGLYSFCPVWFHNCHGALTTLSHSSSFPVGLLAFCCIYLIPILKLYTLYYVTGRSTDILPYFTHGPQKQRSNIWTWWRRYGTTQRSGTWANHSYWMRPGYLPLGRGVYVFHVWEEKVNEYWVTKGQTASDC